jgi:hypothetical protein
MTRCSFEWYFKKCRTCDKNALVSGDVAEVSEGVAGEAAYARGSLFLPAAARLPLPQQQPVRDLPEPGQMGRIMIIPTQRPTHGPRVTILTEVK